ncbi:QRFP-like peptide receptor [Watersipora subatra]|uniref:QRFP-like peptide receptor n=1 Tax=Watersipora subatra TaxID=2589382 RepID=UPI00355B8569
MDYFDNATLLYKSSETLSTSTLSPLSTITTDSLKTTNGSVDTSEDLTNAENIVIFFVFSAIAFLGILFNTLTIIIFTTGRRSSVRDIRILILNLAAVDLVYSISGPIPAALMINKVSFVDNVGICKVFRFVYILSAYGSPLANLGIAIERLIILYSPARTLRLRNRQSVMLIIIGSLWAFNLAITAEYLVSPQLVMDDGVRYCESLTFLERNYSKVFAWLLVVKFCVPSLLIMIIYTVILVKLTMCGPIGNISKDSHLKKQTKARNQMVKMLSLVACITLIAYLPYNLYSITYEYDDPLDNVPKGPLICEMILFAIQLTNGFTSPLVYYGYDRYFKRDLFELFGCRKLLAKSSSSFPTQTTTTARTMKPTSTKVIRVQEPRTTETELRNQNKEKKGSLMKETTWLKSTKHKT